MCLVLDHPDACNPPRTVQQQTDIRHFVSLLLFSRRGGAGDINRVQLNDFKSTFQFSIFCLLPAM